MDASSSKAAAQVRACAGGVFEQHGEAARVEPGGGIPQRGHEIRDAFLHRAASMTAGVQHQVLGADRWVGRGQVHQVADVDHQRVEVKSPARGLEQFDVAGVWHPCAPHARAGGEDLKRVGPQLRRMQRRVFERPRRSKCGCPVAKVHPI